MNRLFLTATGFAAMSAITLGTIAADTASTARAAAPASTATIDVYKDAN